MIDSPRFGSPTRSLLASAMEAIVYDLRQAIKKVAQRPAYAMLAAGTVAIGIAALVSVFSVVNAIHFRALPIPDIDRLVSVSERNPQQVCAGCTVGTSLSTLEDWSAGSSTIERFGAYTYYDPFTVATAEGPQRLHGSLVSSELFAMLGVRPILGRSIVEDDDRIGAEPVVIISHALWQGAFHGDSTIPGRTLVVDGVSRRIIGVMPPRMDFPYQSSVWLPLRPARAAEPRDARNIYVIGRLAPGASLAAASNDLQLISRRIAQEYAGTNRGWSVSLEPLRSAMTEEYAGRYPLFLVSVLLVLLVVCANVASIELARAGPRGPELSLRTALGGSRGRLVRQLIFESLVVSVAGGVLGALGAVWGVEIVASLYQHLPYWVEVGLDGRVLAVAVGASVSTGLLAGLSPALVLTRRDIGRLFSGGARLTGGRDVRRWQAVTIVAQVAITIVLLTGAAGSLRFYARLHDLNVGWDPGHGLASGDVQLLESRYAGAAAQAAFIRAASTTAAAPNVSVAAWSLDPSLPRTPNAGVSTEAGLVPNANVWRFLGATAGYFETLRLPLLSGRTFTPAEERDGSAVIVSQAVADSLWPGTPAVGRRIKRGAPGDPGSWMTVVGVAASPRSARMNGWQESRFVYVPLLAWPSRDITLYARDTKDGSQAIAALRRTVGSIDPTQPIDRLTTVERQLADSRRPAAVSASLLLGFSVFTLVLAAVGLAVLITHVVQARTRELGIRIALGASTAGVVYSAMQRATRLATVGVGVGTVAALGAGKVLGSTVRGFPEPSMLAIGLSVALMAIVALSASFFPARRAATIDPAITLREP